jgi:hypothetical protein
MRRVSTDMHESERVQWSSALLPCDDTISPRCPQRHQQSSHAPSPAPTSDAPALFLIAAWLDHLTS